jgi:choice-of-anchor B domain-containing protein
MKKLHAALICLLGFQCSLGFAQNNNIELKSTLAFTNSGTANIWGFVKGNTEYALVGLTGGAGNNNACAIVDITNATNPLLKFTIPGPNSIWREIRTWGNYAYITTEASDNTFGITIANLSYLPDSVPTKQFTLNGVISNVHALQIDAGYLYLYGANNSLSNGGALILDLSDPWNPTYAGAYNTRYIHDGYVKNNKLYAGEIFAGQFSIVDVTNKATPIVINSQSTPNQFTHNTWLSSDGNILYTTDEITDATVTSYDISDNTNIKYLDSYKRIFSNGAIPHNTYVLNNPAVTGFATDFVLTSYYNEGVTIVDAARPANLVEVGNYDTNNLSGSSYDGTWGVYGFLPSGNLILSDMTLGLFVVKPTYKRAAYLEGTIIDAATGLAIPNASIEISSNAKLKYSGLDGTFKTGTVDTGLIKVSVFKTGYRTVSTTFNFSSGVVNNQTINLYPDGTGVNDFNNKSPWIVYPTTFDASINIQLNEISDGNISITDISGCQVFQTQSNGESVQQLDLSNLAAGMYVIKYTNQSNQTFQQKIFKK